MNTKGLIGIIKKEKLIELMKDVDLSEDVEKTAERILEIPSSSGVFGRMTQKEADLISEPKD